MLLVFILLSIWLCRPMEKVHWLRVSEKLSQLMFAGEHPARGLGLR
ncbi:hypothetical protein U0868_20210 [Kluyvera ascorbata]|nr:hypothetical protein [Kluyvera ascorbata]MDZ4033879.1 hypothetical protein [Kluyvera ascorbata]